MIRTIKKQSCIILTAVMTIFAPFSAFAETNAVSTEIAINNVMDSTQIKYTLDGDTVIETTTFIDVDNTRVDMWRSVETDGTGKLIINKSEESSTTTLSDQDYELFVKLVEAKPLLLTRGATIGKDIVGSQYKHVYIASNTATINNSAISQVATGTVSTALGIVIGYFNAPAGVATSLASLLYSTVRTLSPSKVIINQTVNEVHFTYDNAYYTHCYHENLKSYDSGGHLIDTTIMYKQSIGG